MRLLQPGQGDIPTDAYVRSSPETLRWGRLPQPDTTPVARLASGDAITFDTVSHEGLLGDQGADAVTFFGGWGIGAHEVLDDVRELAGTALGRELPHDGPHAVLGPVEVAGARVGDVLCIETLALDFRAPYGIVSNRHGRGVLAGELPRAAAAGGEPPAVVSTLARVGDDGRGRIDTPSGHALRFDLRPFLGLVGVTPAEPDAASSTPPGRHGGNLDVRHLGVGSRLLLPVQVDGAGLYVSDPHFAQGNGEVALTAFEAPLRATLRTTVWSGGDARRLAATLQTPWGETRTHTIVIAVGDTVDEALRQCVRNAVALVVDRTGVDEQSALAFLSAAADFEISQAVNLVVGVHCLIRTTDLDG
ncbi:acetamidase/formamidase family protein [soil metagenome]